MKPKMLAEELKTRLPNAYHAEIDRAWRHQHAGDLRGLDELICHLKLDHPMGITWEQRTIGRDRIVSGRLDLPSRPYALHMASEFARLYIGEFSPRRYRWSTPGGAARMESDKAEYEARVAQHLPFYCRLALDGLMRLFFAATFRHEIRGCHGLPPIYGPRAVDYYGNPSGEPVTAAAWAIVEQEANEALNWVSHHKPRMLALTAEAVRAIDAHPYACCRADRLPKLAGIDVNRWTPRGAIAAVEKDADLVAHAAKLHAELNGR